MRPDESFGFAWFRCQVGRFAEALAALGLPFIISLFLPWLVLRHLLALHRTRRFVAGALLDEQALTAKVEDGFLVLGDGRYPLATIDRVESMHVSGDQGYADGNELHYLVRIVRHGGPDLCAWISHLHPWPLNEAFFEPLRADELLMDHSEVRGYLHGGVLSFLLPVLFLCGVALGAVVILVAAVRLVCSL